MSYTYDSDGNVIQDPNFSWVDNHVEPLKITVTKAPPAWVDSTPTPLQNPDSSPADIAAYRVAQSVKRPSRLPVEQTLIPDAPTRPSYVMEPDLQEAQGGMQLPPGMMQDDSGRLFYADDPTTTIPMVRRPGLLPVANTPEGLKLVMPKMLDIASNVMGNVGGLAGGAVAAKAGEMVLGSGMVVRKAAEEAPKVAENAPAFYSSLERAVSGAKVDKADASQWLGYLKNQPGVKSEEINTVLGGKLPDGQISRSQLEDIVKQNKVHVEEKVLGDNVKSTRDNYEKHAKVVEDAAGKLDDEIHKISGTTSFNFQGNKIYADELSHGLFSGDIKPSELPTELQSVGKELADAFKARETARYEMQQANNDKALPIYKQYQLPGEAENYKETLLKFPANPEKKTLIAKNEASVKRIMKIDDEIRDNGHTLSNDEILKLAHEKVMLSNELKETAKKLDAVQNSGYKAPHFGEHGEDLFAHSRTNERTLPNDAGKKAYDDYEAALRAKYGGEKSSIGGANGNTISKATNEEIAKLHELGKNHHLTGTHVEELQGDWPQAIRDFGYKGEVKKLQPDFDKIEAKLMATNDEKLLGLPTVKEVLAKAVEDGHITKAEAQIYKRYTDIENTTTKAPPDMPFKKNYDELLIKKTIMDAVAKGHKFISVTPGEAQALRYQNEIRQKVNSIEWHNKNSGKVDPDGNKHVLIDAHSGEMNLTVDKRGTILSGHKDLKGKTLDEAIGKDIARQILEKPEGNIDAKGYVMGAEGMKGYYDKMVIDKYNNIVKKYGAKMEPFGANLPNTDKYTIKRTGDIHDEERGASVFHVYKNGDVDKTFKTRKEAEDYTNSSKGQPVHIMHITPALEKKAKEGFELFSSSPNLVPVTHNPFDDNQNKKYRLIPVSQPPEF